VLVLALAVGLGWPAAALDRDEMAAIRNAEAWLTLVDQRRYGESWDTAAVFFKDGVDRATWAEALGAVRGPLGKLLFRRVKLVESKATLPGAPDGKYVVIQYDASFENKKAAVETVTPMLEEGGSWKVIGYTLK
jgi:hypothetical protein